MALPLAALALRGLPALMKRALPALMKRGTPARGMNPFARRIDPRMFTARRPGMGRRAMDWMNKNPWKTGGLGLLPFMIGGRTEEEELGMPLDVSPSLDMPPSPVSDMHPEDIMELLRDSEGEPVTWGDDYTIGTGGAFDDVGRYIKPSDRVDSGEVDLLELFGIR